MTVHPHPRFVRAAASAMGTRFELVIAGDNDDDDDDDDDEIALRAIAEEALREIIEWDHRLSYFRRDSLVSLINREAASRAIRLDDDVFDLLRYCLDVSRLTGGAFDITVAPLMAALGFRDDDRAIDTSAARSLVDWRRVELDETKLTVRFAASGVRIDLGAVGKGFALDRAAQRLRESGGVACALLHGGTSSVIGVGAPPGEEAWRVAVRDPAVEEPAAWPIVKLRNSALGVSAQHGRTIETGGGSIIGHIIDPRAGASASRQGRGRFAAVIADSAMSADAWSTALLVLGGPPQAALADRDEITAILPNSADPHDGYTISGPRASAVVTSALGHAGRVCEPSSGSGPSSE